MGGCWVGCVLVDALGRMCVWWYRTHDYASIPPTRPMRPYVPPRVQALIFQTRNRTIKIVDKGVKVTICIIIN